ncbi:MAG TPA: DUF3160 domain-containing protein [Anaerolineae bacterium]|nr:DUF3160 domain-containing protein [Anaerolineae bacterium]
MIKRRIVFGVAILVLVVMSCTITIPSATQPSDATQATTEPGVPTDATEPPTGPTPEPPEGVYPPVFASYQQEVVTLPSSFSGYSLPVDLNDVEGVDDFGLSPAQLSMLSQNGFVVAPPGIDEYQEFYQIYEDWRYRDGPLFITTDSVLHVYHLLFDKLLRDLEREHFIPDLQSLIRAMITATQEQLTTLTGTALEEQARRNLAFFVVAAELMDIHPRVAADVRALVDAEMALIEAHSIPSISPIWDRDDLAMDDKLIEDYTQYIPRGHYTRSEDLQRYFKSMMWFGRLTYRLRDEFETQRALLLTEALRTAVAQDGTPATILWGRIFEPTVFLVGKADDLSYFEYSVLSDSIFGVNPLLESFADPELMADFMEAARLLPPPQVNSMWVWIWQDKTEATQGFRFMGQRFTIDAYVFGQMIWRNVGIMGDERWLPKALDFFAAMGSNEALSILDDMGETAYENFNTQMDKVRDELAATGVDTWTENVYWSWLYALQPIVEVKGESYPEFMRTQAWTRRDLNAALGSYTELKHDTILYAKQVMAEMGGGPMENPAGYVEPNPEAYARLEALALMTHSGLADRGLLTERMRQALENLIDLLGFLRTTSEKELAGQPLTQDDYWRIQFYGGELEALTVAAADCDDVTDCRDLEDQRAALIADVATGSGTVLEEAIGDPARIFVVLPDAPLRLAVGAVFSYYEFTVAASDRMTDEQWQAMIDAGTNPAQPEWTDAFVTP